VLRALGYNADHIEKLYSEGVLYDKYRDQPTIAPGVPHESPVAAAE
jgi:hypothetical protein